MIEETGDIKISIPSPTANLKQLDSIRFDKQVNANFSRFDRIKPEDITPILDEMGILGAIQLLTARGYNQVECQAFLDDLKRKAGRDKTVRGYFAEKIAVEKRLLEHFDADLAKARTNQADRIELFAAARQAETTRRAVA